MGSFLDVLFLSNFNSLILWYFRRTLCDVVFVVLSTYGVPLGYWGRRPELGAYGKKVWKSSAVLFLTYIKCLTFRVYFSVVESDNIRQNNVHNWKLMLYSLYKKRIKWNVKFKSILKSVINWDRT
uniref:Uncharacterized protein n=1 Tax=Heterorhabditis bacteriophora TaxID=37862 RepID=A0A1I7WA75_HETBA